MSFYLTDQRLGSRTERARRLAETYDGASGWERVDEYERVMRWRAAHTEGGAYAASRALGLPRGRIRPWFDGAKPHAQRAIETAARHGWLDAEPGSRAFEGLVVLHAWLLASGSIASETFVPSCVIGTDDPEGLLRAAFDAVGVPSRIVSGESDGRTAERRPSGSGGSHLGRFLAGVLGAPVGSKVGVSPAAVQWLESAPRSTRIRWSQTYTVRRGRSLEARPDGFAVRLGGRCDAAYREAVLAVFGSVVDDAELTATADAVLLGPKAARCLRRVPTLPPQSADWDESPPSGNDQPSEPFAD